MMQGAAAHEHTPRHPPHPHTHNTPTMRPARPHDLQVFSQPVFAAVERLIRHKKNTLLAHTGRWAFRITFRSFCECRGWDG